MVNFTVLGAVGGGDSERLISLLCSICEGAAMDADMVCGADHLRSAAFHAVRAFDRGTNACTTLAVETVLYASGERQISKGVKKMGLRPGSRRVALVLFDVPDADAVLTALGLERDDSVLDAHPDKARRLGITDEEMAAVPPERYVDLVLERVAFVDITK